MSMDIPRQGVAEQKRRRRILYSVAAMVVVAVVSYGLYQVEPAAPRVRRAEVVIGSVERGDMVREVRGPGTLVPEEIRWISVETEARVERIVVLPGAVVESDTVLIELSNPELEQSTTDAELRLRASEAEYSDLKVRLESELLNAKADAARVQSDYRQALLQVEANEELAKDNLIPALTLKLSRLVADELANRNQIEKERLVIKEKSVEAQLASRRARLEQDRALYDLRLRQLRSLDVRPGISGVLQQVAVEEGQRVTPGTALARVAQPDRLKAELRIPETQAKDLQHGQLARIDTRNGIIEGEVVRIDPAVENGTVTVDVELRGPLPKGARPDLSVDGTVQIEHLHDILYMQRPMYGQANSTVGLFRIQEDGVTATRSQVELGRSSVSLIEVVRGLGVGDQVILSDASRWDDVESIRLD